MNGGETPRKTKVLLFTTMSYIGGTERSFLALASHLDTRRFDVWLAALEPGGPLLQQAQERGIRTFTPRFTSYFHPRYLWETLKFFRRNRVDVLCVAGLKLKLFLLPLATLMRIPVRVSAIRGLDPWKGGGLLWLEKCLHRFTTLWIANSQAAKQCAVEREGKPADRIHVIYQGLAFGPQPAPPLRGDSAPGPFNIGILANIRPGKGHEFFLEVLQALVNDGESVKVQFIGVDFTGARTTTLVKKLKLQDHVMMTGFIADVTEYLRSEPLDLMVLPSFSESLPTSLIEAMSAGLPVVASRVGGVPELIRHRENGWLVEPGNRQELLEAIRTLRNDPDMRARLANQALTDVRAQYTIDRATAEYEQVFQTYLRRN